MAVPRQQELVVDIHSDMELEDGSDNPVQELDPHSSDEVEHYYLSYVAFPVMAA